MTAHSEGRDVVRVSNNDVGKTRKNSHNTDVDNEALHLARAATIVRIEMLKMKSKFTGNFDIKCQGNSVSPSLVEQISMIQFGPNIKDQCASSLAQSTLSLSQLLVYNSSVRQ